MNPIYMDYAATTPVDPQVAEKMAACLTLDGNFANPASRSHRFGWMAEEAVETARGQLADLLGADVREIVWTSGATESNNLAIKGALEAMGNPANQDATKRHIITSKIEHKAVLDCCAHLETLGYSVTYLEPQQDGRILPEQVQEAMTDSTALVSIMFVNNELGCINPIKDIADVCRANGVIMHTDAAQAVGKIRFDVADLGVDLLSVCAHKFYGPKGIGALYVKRGVKVCQQIHGGGHERGMRSGTLATHQIVGLGEAAQLCAENFDHEHERLNQLLDSLKQGLLAITGAQLNGSHDQHVSGIANISFSDVDGESLLLSLPQLAVSSGSACNSATMAPSYVLKAIGLDDDLAHASIRFSIGRFTQESDIHSAIEYVSTAVNRLRGMAA